jgi:hypothetical protein
MNKPGHTFEHVKSPLLDVKSYRKRQLRFMMYAFILILISLGIGMMGYRSLADLEWIDAFYNAAMILTGMGPATELHSNVAKIFAGCYSIFCGIIFMGTVAILFTPMVHRFLHKIHLES